jgi:hypothetical protein
MLGPERSHDRRPLPARVRRDEVERVHDMRFFADGREARASQALAKALLERTRSRAARGDVPRLIDVEAELDVVQRRRRGLCTRSKIGEPRRHYPTDFRSFARARDAQAGVQHA